MQLGNVSEEENKDYKKNQLFQIYIKILPQKKYCYATGYGYFHGLY